MLPIIEAWHNVTDIEARLANISVHAPFYQLKKVTNFVATGDTYYASNGRAIVVRKYANFVDSMLVYNATT